MIRITPPVEPQNFDVDCRQPGNRWLANHPDGDPPGKYWRPFTSALCEGFGYRCGYSAMWDLNGTIDHYTSQKNQRELSFEWSNFRYASGWLNSSKQTLDHAVLDPFVAKDEWFEIIFPSLIMQLTSCVPQRLRRVAEFTLTRLHLADGDRVYEQRKIDYDAFQARELPMNVLEKQAPILATAIQRERVLSYLNNHANIRVPQVAQLCETTPEHARYLVKLWVRVGHLRSQGKGRGVCYIK